MEISLGEAITMTARNKPDAPSFVFADGSAHTFAQTNARVNRLVAALQAEGIKRGGRLAVFSLDSHRHVEIVLAGHSAVAQSAIVGVPDEHWSEIVRAWVTPAPRRYRDSRRTRRPPRAAAGHVHGARRVPVHRRAAGRRQWQDTQARAARQGLRQEAP
jgi:acyl-CoA synthetase (AMP-forming)/AMP-acid ligase II